MKNEGRAAAKCGYPKEEESRRCKRILEENPIDAWDCFGSALGSNLKRPLRSLGTSLSAVLGPCFGAF